MQDKSYIVEIQNFRKGSAEMKINCKKLVVALLDKDMTQTKLAEVSGVSRPTISGIKAGRKCSDETGYKIAAALDVPIEKLLEK